MRVKKDGFAEYSEILFLKEKRVKMLQAHLKRKDLYWSEKSPNKMCWNDAKQYCENLTEGGFSDWRLPNIDELRTLIQNHSGTQTGGTCPISEKAGKLSWDDRTSDCNGIKGSDFSKLGDMDWLWSSSVQSGYSPIAWGVGFYYGDVSHDDARMDNPLFNHYVRCVR